MKIIKYALLIDQSEILEQVAYFRSKQESSLARAECGIFYIAYREGTAVRSLKQSDNIQQRAFARAAFSGNREERSFRHLQRKVIKYIMIAI